MATRAVPIRLMPSESGKHDVFSLMARKLRAEKADPCCIAITFRAIAKMSPLNFPFAAREVWRLGLDDVDFENFAVVTSGKDMEGNPGMTVYEAAVKLFGLEVMTDGERSMVRSSRDRATGHVLNRKWALPGLNKRDGKRYYVPRIYLPEKSAEEVAELFQIRSKYGPPPLPVSEYI